MVVFCAVKIKVKLMAFFSLFFFFLGPSPNSDGVWDPEKWHASLYPTSERSSPVEGFKKDYMDDRVPLKRRIPGKKNITMENCLHFFFLVLDVLMSQEQISSNSFLTVALTTEYLRLQVLSLHKKFAQF